MEAVNTSINGDSPMPKPVNINIDMKDMILTPHTCVCLIIEILKVLLYEKLQLPYPYSWLKNAINRKKLEAGIHPHNISIILQKYFNLASNAYNFVEDITKHLTAMLMIHGNNVQEVVILFGSTPYTPKEVFTFRFPQLAKGHSEINHKSMLQRKLHKVLRSVFLSNQWLNAMEADLQVTNTFIMVKKIGVLRHDDEYFNRYNNFAVPASVRNTCITFNYDAKHDTCCENLRVYGDNSIASPLSSPPTPLHSIQSRNVEWLQAKGMVKGFQDFFIEKVSVSELW